MRSIQNRMKKTGAMKTPVVKIFYYGECSLKDKVEEFAEHCRQNYRPGTYLIKVWNDGLIGFYKVA